MNCAKSVVVAVNAVGIFSVFVVIDLMNTAVTQHAAIFVSQTVYHITLLCEIQLGTREQAALPVPYSTQMTCTLIVTLIVMQRKKSSEKSALVHKILREHPELAAQHSHGHH